MPNEPNRESFERWIRDYYEQGQENPWDPFGRPWREPQPKNQKERNGIIDKQNNLIKELKAQVKAYKEVSEMRARTIIKREAYIEKLQEQKKILEAYVTRATELLGEDTPPDNEDLIILGPASPE